MREGWQPMRLAVKTVFMSQSDLPAPSPAKRNPRRTLTWIVLVLSLCVIAGTIIWWYAGLRNQFFPDNFGVVEPGRIYRSAQISARVIHKTLADNHIKVIIDLANDESP